MKTFAEFWPFYLSEHSLPLNRWLHFLGSSLAGIFVAAAISLRNVWFLPAALVAGYGFAWIGHFGFEKNRPATFKHPLWSFFGDWKMWYLMLTGRLQGELARRATGSR